MACGLVNEVAIEDIHASMGICWKRDRRVGTASRDAYDNQSISWSNDSPPNRGRAAAMRGTRWQGETFKPLEQATEQKAETVEVPQSIQEDGKPHAYTDEELKPWIQTIAWKPRAFVYHNFLSHSEAAHIISLASPQMKRSTVVGANNSGVVNNIRTSAGTFLRRNQDSVISAIEQRLAVWSQLPPENQEDMQVLRYGPTNKYGPHLDGLGRVMSVLIYLVAPEEGGETAFPQSDGWLHREMSTKQGKFSSCAEGHVAYKPKVGDALMFFDLKPTYKEPDGFSQHTGCPVVKGVKWNAVKWIHGIPFREPEWQSSMKSQGKAKPAKDPGMCIDMHPRCQDWADSGQCEANEGYMKGSNSGQGACRKACKVCQACNSPDDLACIRANREAAGYENFNPEEYGFLKDMVLKQLATAKQEIRQEEQETL
eukprot:gene21598-28597_t